MWVGLFAIFKRNGSITWLSFILGIYEEYSNVFSTIPQPINYFSNQTSYGQFRAGMLT